MMKIAKANAKSILKSGVKKTQTVARISRTKENKKKLLKALKSGHFSGDTLTLAKKLLGREENGSISGKPLKNENKADSTDERQAKKKRKLEDGEDDRKTKIKKVKKEPDEKKNSKEKKKKLEDSGNDVQTEKISKKKKELDKKNAKEKKKQLDDAEEDRKNEKIKKIKGDEKNVSKEEDGYLSKRQLKVKDILNKKIRPEGLSKKERRALRVSRRKDGGLIQRLLAMWEELRVASCPEDRRAEICQAILGQASGKIPSLVLAHDTCRVFETVIKVGTEEQRLRVLEEVKGQETMRGVMRSKFGKFLLHKMLHYGSGRHKERVFHALEGNVVRMLHHRQAIHVLNAAFSDYATANQRSSILQETFGPPFSVLKEPGVCRLKEAFAARPDTNKESVLVFLKNALTKAISKGNVNYLLIHTLLLDFLETCGEADRTEVVGLLKEHVVALLHTREGVKTAMMVLWMSNNKDRKSILRSLKTFFANTAVDEHGYLFILACLDVVDDIVLLSKLVIKELLESLETLLGNAHGRKVVLYMLSRRNAIYFHPQLLDVLMKGDSNPYTKKESVIRNRELRERILPPLLAFVISKISIVCSPNNALTVLREVLVVAAAEKAPRFSDLVKEIVKLLLSEEAVCAGGKENLTENTGAHITLKKAMQATKNEELSLGQEMLNLFHDQSLQKLLLTNRGCFLLVSVVETTKDGAQKLAEMLKPDLSVLAQQKSQGAGILKKKLKPYCGNVQL